MVVKSGNFIIKRYIFFLYCMAKSNLLNIKIIPYRTHNILRNHIIQCYPIDIIFFFIMKCIILCGLMNSEHILFNNLLIRK